MIAARERFPVWLVGALVLVLLIAAWSFSVGRFPVSPGDVWRALWAAMTGSESGLPANAQAVVTGIRAPRVAAALLVGAALAAAGASYQNLFRNPLVSPDILGVASGCALGAGTAIVLSLPVPAVYAAAFAGGLAATVLVVAIGTWVGGRDPILTLILTGVVVGSLFAAGIALVKFVADPYDQLPAIVFWLLGSFAGVLPGDLAIALPPMLGGVIALWLLRWRIDVLALSDDEARALGVDATRLRRVVIVAATLATAAAVSLAGTIGWVGLVVPHAARLVVGASFPRVLPISMVLGAGFMLAVDTLCRVGFPSEIPPGVATAFVGTPVFIALLALAFRRSA